jgi:hypothetical protein
MLLLTKNSFTNLYNIVNLRNTFLKIYCSPSKLYINEKRIKHFVYFVLFVLNLRQMLLRSIHRTIRKPLINMEYSTFSVILFICQFVLFDNICTKYDFFVLFFYCQ